MFKITKKEDSSFISTLCWQLAAIVAAIVCAGIVIACMGYSPVDVYSKMIEGAVGNARRFTATIEKTIPLIILSLGIAVAFKMKFWNIGAEGQMAMGGFGAALVALNAQTLPSYVLLPLMFLAGALMGGLWALIAALLKVKLGTSETLVTLMLNYVALKWITYLQYGPWRADGQGFPIIPQFEKTGVLPTVFGIHIGWIISLVLVIAVYILIKYSKFGYELSVLGESPATAKYAGINVVKITIIAVLISGGLCGAAGMVQTSAVEKTLSESFTGGIGFTAVITTWLARLSPVAIVVTSFLYAILIRGGVFIETALKIPSAMSDVISGIIIIFVLSFDFFAQYKLSFKKPLKKEAK